MLKSNLAALVQNLLLTLNRNTYNFGGKFMFLTYRLSRRCQNLAIGAKVNSS